MVWIFFEYLTISDGFHKGGITKRISLVARCTQLQIVHAEVGNIAG
jgi:hypothetical protein